MKCHSCGTLTRIIWSPLFCVYLCGACLDRRTEAELRTKKTEEWLAAHGGDINQILGVPQWLF